MKSSSRRRLGRIRKRDRISTLPDEVICHILSFLPTQSAVETGILSRRWRFLWTYLCNFNFIDTTDNVERKPNKASFVNFVSFVLNNLSSSIQNFHLTCSSYCEPFLHTWISIAVNHKVEEVKLDFYLSKQVMPHMLLTCSTLVVLNLSNIILYLPSPVWLPRLRVLHLLRIKYKNKNDGTVQKLLCGCPTLEDLVIVRWKLDKEWDIYVSSPTLKSFIMVVYITNGSLDYLRREYKVVLNTPNLEYLDLVDNLTNVFVGENLSSLVKACVDITSKANRIVEFVKSVAHVKYLTVSAQTLCVLGYARIAILPTFHNVTRLKLGSNGDSCWELLTHFLENSPNLEILILNKEEIDYGFEPSVRHWRQPQHVPNCLVSHLKEVEIKQFSGEEFELEAIEYVLKNATVLKKLAIDCNNYLEKNLVCKKLESFPCGSRDCQLSLHLKGSVCILPPLL